MQNAGQVYPYL